MSILGIGPLLALVGILAGGVVVALVRWGVTIELPAGLHAWELGAGIILMAVGVVFWLGSAALVRRALGEHRLETKGVYGVSRNPMYAGFIVFLIPGLALVVNELLLLLIPAAMFVAFKMRIAKEEDYMAKEFGEEFERYRKSVSQLVPFLRV